MPSWKRIVVSGSDASLNTLTVSNGITGSLYGTASYAIAASSTVNAQDILIYVKNSSGTQIDKGKVVQIAGAVGDNPLIATASYTSDNNSANTLGITNENIAHDSFGYVMTEGRLIGINTSTFTAGQLIYLGATGSIIGTAPLAPLHAVRLGQVLRSQLNNGSIYIRVDNGFELGELHDVLDNTTTGSYGDLLVKSGSIWINSKQLTGSYAITGSLTATSFTGSLQGTASYATQALSASFAPSTPAFPFTGSAIITGSLNVIGNTTITGSTNITNGSLEIKTGNGTAAIKATGGGQVLAYYLKNSSDTAVGILGVNINSGEISIGGYASAYFPIFYSNGGEKWRIATTGTFSNTSTTGTAYIHLKAGTAAASSAPLKLTAGTNLTTPEAGTIEFNGTNLFFTTGSTRSTILTNISPASITGNLILTGSLLVSGSVRLNGNAGVNITGNTVITGSLGVTGGITGSLQGTASYATQALSASFAPSTPAFPFTGSAIITGSLNVIGNTAITGSLVAGYNPTPLAGTIQDGVTSVLGNLYDWNSNFYQGTVLYSETAGGTITFGQLCYRTMFEAWELADAADATQPLAFNMLGICVKTAGSGSATSILINGFVETPYVTIGKSGEPLYMDTTAGSMNYTAPTTVGNAVRLIGNTFWDSNSQGMIVIHFNPDRSWIEL